MPVSQKKIFLRLYSSWEYPPYRCVGVFSIARKEKESNVLEKHCFPVVYIIVKRKGMVISASRWEITAIPAATDVSLP